jgi:putative transposase
MFAAEIRARRREGLRSVSRWRWHLDKVFVRVNGVQHYLWRAVDHEGEVLEAFVTKRRDRAAALRFLKKLMKRHGRPEEVVTDKLRSYGAALKEMAGQDRQVTERRQNNRAENSHQPFRRRSAPCSVPKHALPPEVRRRPLLRAQPLQRGAQPLFTHRTTSQARTAALVEWRGLCAG